MSLELIVEDWLDLSLHLHLSMIVFEDKFSYFYLSSFREACDKTLALTDCVSTASATKDDIQSSFN